MNWIHLPEPRGRNDEASYAALKKLRVHPGTEVYPGWVHDTDGLAGAQARIRAAQTAISNLGVATECGMGRRPPDTIPGLLKLHAQIASPIR